MQAMTCSNRVKCQSRESLAWWFPVMVEEEAVNLFNLLWEPSSGESIFWYRCHLDINTFQVFSRIAKKHILSWPSAWRSWAPHHPALDSYHAPSLWPARTEKINQCVYFTCQVCPVLSDKRSVRKCCHLVHNSDTATYRNQRTRPVSSGVRVPNA